MNGAAASGAATPQPPAERAESRPGIGLRIHLLRGQRVLLDADLTALPFGHGFAGNAGLLGPLFSL